VARIYDQRGDQQTEREILQQAADLDPGAPSTRIAQNRLKQLSPQAPAMSFPVTAPNASVPAPPTK